MPCNLRSELCQLLLWQHPYGMMHGGISVTAVGSRSKGPGFDSRSGNVLSSKYMSSKRNPYWWLHCGNKYPRVRAYTTEFPDSINISVPALELQSRAVPSVGGYHHRSVRPTTGRNPGGRQKKTSSRILWWNSLMTCRKGLGLRPKAGKLQKAIAPTSEICHWYNYVSPILIGTIPSWFLSVWPKYCPKYYIP